MQTANAPIAEHAAIGDCRSLALVTRDGCIDWFCPQEFAAPSVFAALLDVERGGRFAVGVPGEMLREPPVQRYGAGSNVLHTRFTTARGVVQVTDFMSLPERGPGQEIARMAECLEGDAELQVHLEPRPGYASEQPRPRPLGANGFSFRAQAAELALFTSRPLHADAHGVAGTWTLRAGQREALLLRVGAGAGASHAPADLRAYAADRLAHTDRWWQAWSARMTYTGPYRDAVLRSLLALKLLAYAPTGAVVAAATTSLPEDASGQRNWDYRYCWLRDSSLVLRAFVDLGYGDEGSAFLRWLLHATRSTRPRLQVVYDVHGGSDLPERVLPQLRGHQGVGPVRVGNAAGSQLQLDVYGEVLRAAWEHARRGGTLDAQECGMLAGLCEQVCASWREPDHGIWEIRLPPRQNTHSKLMCWAALDAGLRLQASHALPVDRARLARECESIRADIEAHGFSPRVHSYTGYYGNDAADASLLMIPRLGYLPASDPRVEGTVRHVFTQLQAHGLLYRYPPNAGYDGVEGPEHLFAICNFWAVDCLARMGRVRQARDLYERLLGLRNAVGLYAEEFSEDDGHPIGNFPQAFSHVGLVTGALALQEAGRRGGR